MFYRLVALADHVILDPRGNWPPAVEMMGDPVGAAEFLGSCWITLEDAEEYAERHDPLDEVRLYVSFVTATLAYFLALSHSRPSAVRIGLWAIGRWFALVEARTSSSQTTPRLYPVAEDLLQTFLDQHHPEVTTADRIRLLVQVGNLLLQTDGPDWPARQEAALQRYDEADELLAECDNDPELVYAVTCARADLRQRWYFGDRLHQLELAVDEYRSRAIPACKRMTNPAVLEGETLGRLANVYLGLANRLEFDGAGIRNDTIVSGRRQRDRREFGNHIEEAIRILDRAEELNPTSIRLCLFRASAHGTRAWFRRRHGDGLAVEDARVGIRLFERCHAAVRLTAGMERLAAQILSDLAGLYNFVFDIDGTLPPSHLFQSLDAADRLLGRMDAVHPRINLLYNLGTAHRNQARWDDSYHAFLEAVGVISDRLRTEAGPVINHHRLAYLNRQGDLTEKLVYLAVRMNRTNDALRWSEWSAAYELSDLLRVRRVLEVVTPGQERLRRLRQVIDANECGHLVEEASAVWGRSHREPHDPDAYLDDAELSRLGIRDRNGQEADLRQEAAWQHQQLMGAVADSWAELPANTSDSMDTVENACETAALVNAAVLYITPSRWGTSIVLALPNRVAGGVLPVTRQQIADVLDDYHFVYHRFRSANLAWLRSGKSADEDVMRDRRDEWFAALAGEDDSLVERLSQLLWQPLRQWLEPHYPGGVQEERAPALYVVVRGGLSHVPFHALFTMHDSCPTARSVADDEYVVSIVPSAAHLRACLGRPIPEDGKLLLVVDRELQGAEDEARRVSHLFDQQVTPAASRVDVEREWPNCTAALFATHARHDLRSPWMRTSVDISGAERLFVADILRLPLMGTAVFSGCETASGGSLSDSECITLAAAALNAGCRSAVGSLWCAGDVCSAPIIEHFFTQLRRDPSRASVALWHARRAARRREVEQAERDDREQEVHAWATFVAYGV